MSVIGPGGRLGRRQLLACAAGSAMVSLAAGAMTIPRSAVSSWDIFTDVLVVGSGAAGVCAALGARAQDARVLLIESLAGFGGTTALSPGVVYAGGGTALQRSLAIEDSVEAMYDFLLAIGSPHQPLDKLQRYCEESAAHFDWLVAQGLSYGNRLSEAGGLPGETDSLFYSGNELAWPARDLAAPAPRGHVPQGLWGSGGLTLMEALLGRAVKARVGLQANARAEQLVVESDGRIAGALIDVAGARRLVRTRRGVVLAAGGFIRNREMVRRCAPQLYDCAGLWGSAGDQGGGINMGIAAGAASQRMHQGLVMISAAGNQNIASGVLVNASGQRFVAEDSFAGILGDAIGYHQGGRAWLITDNNLVLPGESSGLRQQATANSIGDIAVALGLPRGILQQTVAYYNRHAANGIDPLFRKQPPGLRPLQGPPYRAWDLSVFDDHCHAHTLGGLHTAPDGQVLSSLGETIPGLYAAGRTTAGLPGAPYAARGLSIGDCSFFGRLAGAAVAREP